VCARPRRVRVTTRTCAVHARFARSAFILRRSSAVRPSATLPRRMAPSDDRNSNRRASGRTAKNSPGNGTSGSSVRLASVGEIVIALSGGNERARDNVDCLVQRRGTESVRALQLRELEAKPAVDDVCDVRTCFVAVRHWARGSQIAVLLERPTLVTRFDSTSARALRTSSRRSVRLMRLRTSPGVQTRAAPRRRRGQLRGGLARGGGPRGGKMVHRARFGMRGTRRRSTDDLRRGPWTRGLDGRS